MMFEWDEAKNRANIAKHGVSFERASQMFEGPVLTLVESRKDYGEVRMRSIGRVENVVVLAVIHTDREGRTRIISARPADRLERKHYEEALQKRTDS
jgi:uncharacterized protein